MIHPNELRIGDKIRSSKVIVFRDSTKDNVTYCAGIMASLTVCAIDPEHLVLEYSFENGTFKQEVPIDSILPIPITKEILLECGFKLVPFYENVYELGDIRVHTDKKGETDKVLFLLYNSSQELAFEKEISSLHHLQNLYYCLIGKELEVKL